MSCYKLFDALFSSLTMLFNHRYIGIQLTHSGPLVNGLGRLDRALAQWPEVSSLVSLGRDAAAVTSPPP
jgi:hypothetical protein